jgi:PAS domain S-box-containing protein
MGDRNSIMTINSEFIKKITELLKEHPEGLSITDIVKVIPLNRNTASRYLDNLRVSGQVEMRHFGMAKLYSLTKRLPVSSVLSVSSEYVMQVDHNLRIIFINTPFFELLEIAEKEVIGKKIDFTRIPAIFDEEYVRLLRWISEGLLGVQRSGELTLAEKNRILSCRVIPVVFPDGQKGVSILFEDITSRKVDEERIRESEERYRKLVEISPDAIILHRDGIVIYANPAAIRLLGAFHADEILGKNILDYVQPEYQASVRNNIRNDLKGRSTPIMEMGMVRIDGVPIMIEGRGVGTFIDGEPAVQVAMRDITERKRAEEQLRLLEISVDSAYDEIFWMDMEAHILYVNDAACRTTGYSREELYAMDIYELDPDFNPERWEESIADLRKNKTQFFQTRHKHKDGVILDVEIGSVYVSWGGQEYAFCFVRDITERKRMDAALRESEARYRSLAEVSQDIIFVIDREDMVVYVNKQAADLLQKPADSIIGKPRRANFPPEIADHQYEALRQVFVTGLPLRNEGPMTLQGEVRWFDHALVPIPGADGTVASVLGVSRDITRRITAEQHQRQNKQKNQFIAEYLVDMIIRQTPDHICVYVSPAIIPLLGYTQQEVLGTTLVAIVHPDDLPGVMRDLSRRCTSGQDTITLTFRIRHKEGHYILFESTTRILRDASGQVTEFLSISRDISSREPQNQGTIR